MLDIYYMIANFGNFELSPYDFNFSRKGYQLKKRVSLRTLAIQLISEYIYTFSWHLSHKVSPYHDIIFGDECINDFSQRISIEETSFLQRDLTYNIRTYIYILETSQAFFIHGNNNENRVWLPSGGERAGCFIDGRFPYGGRSPIRATSPRSESLTSFDRERPRPGIDSTATRQDLRPVCTKVCSAFETRPRLPSRWHCLSLLSLPSPPSFFPSISSESMFYDPVSFFSLFLISIIIGSGKELDYLFVT